jgi:hypothetical protein
MHTTCMCAPAQTHEHMDAFISVRVHTHTHTHTHKVIDATNLIKSLKLKESQNHTCRALVTEHCTVISHSAVGAFCMSNVEEPYCPGTHDAPGDIRCCNNAW